MKYIAIMGFGVVGSGVAEVLSMNENKIARHVGDKVKVKYILDLRDFPGSPFEKLVTHDADEVFNDPEVKVMVETIGGARIAYEYTKRALSLGKSVVTSNKELVATHGPELMELAKKNNCIYLYEAAVGGGIPIIRPLHRCLAANRVVRIAGIVNGTTNYILTNMRDNGVSYEEALKQAQANGYAEANPTADVEGIDAQRKLSILSSIALDGTYVAPSEINTVGISALSLDDIEFAAKIGCKVKLLAVFNNGDEGSSCYVAPHFVRASSVLYPVEDVFNAIVVEGNALGEAMFYGQGAGKLPTASAVVGDILEAVMPVEAGAYAHNWSVPSSEGRVTIPYEKAASKIVVRAPLASAESVKSAFASYETEVALEDSEFALFVRGINNGDVDGIVSGINGAKWMHMYE